MSNLKTVYIASPYSTGDEAMNTHFQCKIFDHLLSSGKVIPIAPLWSHFQHVLFPRAYQDWINYDQALLRLYDCCLRLNVDLPELGYTQSASTGADAEVRTFQAMGKPVFFSIDDLFSWISNQSKGQS